MIKPVRCRCGYIWQRRFLLSAVETGTDLVCPDPMCRSIMSYGAIEKFLQGLGEITYAEPTQPPGAS
jgi:hypothetical protein